MNYICTYDLFTNIFFNGITVVLGLITVVPAQNRSPGQFQMQPLDFQKLKYQLPSNGGIFYTDPKKYDRSIEPAEQINHQPTDPAEPPSNLTVPNMTPSTHPLMQPSSSSEPVLKNEDHVKDSRLQQMVQQLYMAQGQVNVRNLNKSTL